jgi:hypothetical protein
MVLGRHPKKYKHFIKIITSQLMIYEQIITTSAKVPASIYHNSGQTSQKGWQSTVVLRPQSCQWRNISD